MFNSIKRAWRRFVNSVNVWLYKRHMWREIREGRIKDFLMRETDWRPVVMPSENEVTMTICGEPTKLITTLPDYPRKVNGKYPCASPDYCSKCGQDWPRNMLPEPTGDVIIEDMLQTETEEV